MHEFDGDLYGSLLKVCICGYIRPERNFDSMEALVAAIRADIEHAERALSTAEGSEFEALRRSEFFAEGQAEGRSSDNNGV